MALEAHLQQLNADIKALEAEVKSLHTRHDAVFREVSLFEAENKYKNLSKPKFAAPVQPPPDADDAPALIHYSYFDPSISKYFPESAPAEPALASQRMLETISLKATAGHVALTESILRFGGITAFPINSRLYDADEDTLLGLRFDLLSQTSSSFVTPHYIILRRYNHVSKDGVARNPWQVFRYTTPTYVPLQTYSKSLSGPDEAEGLQRFVEMVRSRLVHVQWKHELFDKISAATVGNILGTPSTSPVVSVSRDLQCHRVSWTFHHSSCVVELLCSDSEVESSTCRVGNDSQNSAVSAMLCACDLQSLVTVFYDIVRYMHDQAILSD